MTGFEIEMHRCGFTVSPEVLRELDELGERVTNPQDLDDGMLAVAVDEAQRDLERKIDNLWLRLSFPCALYPVALSAPLLDAARPRA